MNEFQHKMPKGNNKYQWKSNTDTRRTSLTDAKKIEHSKPKPCDKSTSTGKNLKPHFDKNRWKQNRLRGYNPTFTRVERS